MSFDDIVNLQVKDFQRMIANGNSVESVLRLAATKLVSTQEKLEKCEQELQKSKNLG